MKTLIGLVVFIAVLLGIAALVPAFIDPEVNVSRSIEINQTPEVVFNIAKNYDLYGEWNPWSEMDKDAENTVEGEPGTVGSRWTWNGDTVGTGSLTLVEIRPNTFIKGHLEFYKPWSAQADDIWHLDSLGENRTRVTWTYHSLMDGYFMRYMNLSMDGMLGPQLEHGLHNLKLFIEDLSKKENRLKNVENMRSYEQ